MKANLESLLFRTRDQRGPVPKWGGLLDSGAGIEPQGHDLLRPNGESIRGASGQHNALLPHQIRQPGAVVRKAKGDFSGAGGAAPFREPHFDLPAHSPDGFNDEIV